MREIFVYSDESRHRTERFLLLGGLWILREDIGSLEKKIADIRREAGFTKDDGTVVSFLGELKWSKANTKKYLDLYKKVVDVFFNSIKNSQIRACIMLVDTHNDKIKEYNNLKEDGFFKLLYQLYLHNCRTPGIYRIYPDRITNPRVDVNLAKLKSFLNSSLQKKFKDKVNPENRPEEWVKEIKPIDSKTTDLMQMLDVVMGAIGFYQNRHFEKENVSKPKKELMKYVMDHIVYSGIAKFDGKKYLVAKSTRLNIWLFRPKN